MYQMIFTLPGSPNDDDLYEPPDLPGSYSFQTRQGVGQTLVLVVKGTGTTEQFFDDLERDLPALFSSVLDLYTAQGVPTALAIGQIKSSFTVYRGNRETMSKLTK